MHMTLAVGGVESKIIGVGVLKFSVKVNGHENDVTVEGVYYSPKIRRNMLSLSKIEKNGCTFVGKNERINVYTRKHELWFYAKRFSGLYMIRPKFKYCRNVNVTEKGQRNHGSSLECDVSNLKGSKKPVVEKVNNSVHNRVCNDNKSTPSKGKGDAQLWHKRFSHINLEYIINTAKCDAVKGLPKITRVTEECVPCKLAKSKRVSFKPLGRIRSRKPLELIHMDVCGPIPTESRGGNRYFVTFIDDYSRKVTVFPIKNKSDVFECFTQYQRRVERFLNSKIINIRTDNGMEFCNQNFNKFLSDQGIRAERTNVYSPEQNGVSERYNLTAVDGVKTMIKSSGLNEIFWAEALLSFTYTWNRVCHKGQDKTPFELFGGQKPSVAHLKVFGTKAFAGIPRQQRKKLDMRAKPGVMVGYALHTRGYRIWIREENRIIETINVRFSDEESKVDSVLDRIGVSEASFKSEDPTSFSDEEDMQRSRITEEKDSFHEEEEDEYETDVSSTNEESLPLNSVPWYR